MHSQWPMTNSTHGQREMISCYTWFFMKNSPHLCYNYTLMLVYLHRHSSLSLENWIFFFENHQSLTINVQNHLITRQKRTYRCLSLFKDCFSVLLAKVFLTLVEFGHVDYLLCIENMSICNPTKRLPNSIPGKGFKWKCFFYIKLNQMIIWTFLQWHQKQQS